MPTRIEIELTSSSPDGSWTWRAAGAREPRGVLDGSILPGGASVGDQLRVETEHDVDGIRVLAVIPPKEKPARTDVLELLPTEESFDPVIQQRAPGGRTDGRGPRRPRRERPDDGRSDRGDDRRDRRTHRGERPRDGARRDGDDRGRREHTDGDRRPPRDDEHQRRHRPHFTPPPELPQRPKPKRLRPGHQHRTDVLGALPEEQRPIAELALQGIAAVRQRLREDNARLKAAGKPEMPEAGVMRMAEELIPRLRVAEWLDRADAAKRQLDHLDLRDLRSVVAAADDPVVARDESTRALAVELKSALAAKQEEELALWLADVEAALDVGRVVRALRLSSVPPKAGVPFPGSLATRLGEATTAALQPTDGPDRWSAVLEAAAFSPVRSLVTPAAPAEQRSDELLATVRRLGPLLPQVAALYEIEVPTGAAVPKPLRPTARRREPAKRPPTEAEPRQRKSRAPASAAKSPAPAEEPETAEVGAATVDEVAPAAAEEPEAAEVAPAAVGEVVPAAADEPESAEAVSEPAPADQPEAVPASGEPSTEPAGAEALETAGVTADAGGEEPETAGVTADAAGEVAPAAAEEPEAAGVTAGAAGEVAPAAAEEPEAAGVTADAAEEPAPAPADQPDAASASGEPSTEPAGAEEPEAVEPAAAAAADPEPAPADQRATSTPGDDES